MVFARNGFAAASIDDVARAAGLTKGAVYSNFADKSELILVLMEDHIGQRATATLRALALDESDSTSEIVRAVGSTLSAAARSDPEWQQLFLEYWLRAMRDPAIKDNLRARRRAQRRRIAEAIDTVTRERDIELTVTADEAAIALLALSNGLAIENLLDPSTVSEELFGALLAGLIDSAT